MLIDVATAYADTSAADLGFALGLPVLPALGVLDLPRLGLQLRLLGASHQVVLSTSGGADLVETVACVAGASEGLPSTAAAPVRGYHFAARVSRCTAQEIRARASALRERLADDPNALLGRFPGNPDAVTGLLALPEGAGTPEGPERQPTIGWRTWHVYPQTGELVATTTVVRAR